MVGDVIEDGPAEKAGIQRGDVIIGFEGKEVKDSTILKNMVANTMPGKEVAITLIREGQSKSLKAIISEMPGAIPPLSKTFDNQLKGVHVQNIIPALKDNLDIPKRVTGVVITDIEHGSPAERVLLKNDVIMEINRKRIQGTEDYETAASEIKSGENILLLVFRKNATLYITLSEK